jgi:hydrogenase maturation protein HypF
MHTFHIHINGLVQGVGFRPHVYKLATQAGIKGCVNNGIDGVHLIFNANEEDAAAFYNDVITYPPPNAIITHHIFKKQIKLNLILLVLSNLPMKKQLPLRYF